MVITGQKVGQYTVERLIGHGGMGNVYLATSAAGQKVALKLLHMHMTAIPEYVKRFQMEATLARKLTHPNVVRVLDCGQVGEQHFIAMEYIEGESLAQRMERAGIVAPGIKWSGGAEDAPGMASIVDTAVGGVRSRKPAVSYPSYCGPAAPPQEPPVRNLPIPEAIKIMRQVAGVLQAASDIGLVHQDLKPQNILLDRHGNAKVLDFGLAKDADTVSTIHEATGQSLGTPHYMSPEQCHGGRKVDIRSDLYSLGVTGYQMLTGRTPFLGPTAMLLMSQHVSQIPAAACKVNSAVPKNLSLVLERLLAKRRSDRHQTPAELIVDLDRAEHGEAPLKVYRPRRIRHFGLVWVGVAAAAGILLGLIAMLTAPYWPGKQSVEAEIQETRTKAERLWKDKKFDEAVAVLTPVTNKWSDQYPDLKRMLDRIRDERKDWEELVRKGELQRKIKNARDYLENAQPEQALVELGRALKNLVQSADERTEVETLQKKAQDEKRKADLNAAVQEAEKWLTENNPEKAALAAERAMSLVRADPEKVRVDEVLGEATTAKRQIQFQNVLRDARAFLKDDKIGLAQTAAERAVALSQTPEDKAAMELLKDDIEQRRQRLFLDAIEEARSYLRNEAKLETGRMLADRAKGFALTADETLAVQQLQKKFTELLANLRDVAAVLEFTVADSVHDKNVTGKSVAAKLEQGLLDKYRLVSRSKIGEVLTEQKFQLTDLVGKRADPNKAQKLGRLLEAQQLITGDVFQLGEKITVAATVVDAQTGAIRQTAEITADSVDELNTQLEELARILPLRLEEKRAYLYERDFKKGEEFLARERFSDALAAFDAARNQKATPEVEKQLAEVNRRVADKAQQEAARREAAFRAELGKIVAAFRDARWAEVKKAATAAAAVPGYAKDPQIAAAQTLATAGESNALATAARGKGDWQQVVDVAQPALSRLSALALTADSPLQAPLVELRRDLTTLVNEANAQLIPQLTVRAFVGGNNVEGADVVLTPVGGAAPLQVQLVGKTPFTVKLRKGDVLGVKVSLAPRDGKHFTPFTTRFTADRNGVQEIKAVLAEERLPGQVQTVELANGVKLDLVWVPPGEFKMGSEDSDDEKPIHAVSLTKGFWIGRTEVTRQQWDAIMGTKGAADNSTATPGLPMENVAWIDCNMFITKLNQVVSGAGFRLPTEAEWEYAARGGPLGKGSRYAGDDNLDDVGWYRTNSGGKAHPVAQKKANELGLYDMSGNAWEWCVDYWQTPYADGAATDPTGPAKGENRVNRGGSWRSGAESCRAALRDSNPPDYRGPGFRLLRSGL